MNKSELLNWNENKNNWYSYDAKPNTEDFGIDCSGLVANCLLAIQENKNAVMKFNSTKKEGNELEVNATMLGGVDNSRQFNDTSNDKDNTFVQNGDIVYVHNCHIGICSEGEVSYNFSNSYVTKQNINSKYFAVIHNYGTSNIRIADNSLNSESFFEKTIRGPVQHWNLNSIRYSRIYLWN